jgi:predicted dehydrogenase
MDVHGPMDQNTLMSKPRHSSSSWTRREFLCASGAGTLAAGAAVPALRAQSPAPAGSPADALGVGFIGVGIRGEILMRTTLAIPGARVVVAADAYDGHFDRVREVAGAGVATGRDYRTVLDNRDVQAVVISVPDHWHVPMAIDAMKAGKDVYLEKPMTHRWEEGASLVEAARAHKRILQVGSQWDSMPANEAAIEIIKGGRLGKVTLIDGRIHRNTPTGAWYYPVPPDASPETIDWERFIGPAKKVPFDAARFFQWRLFWDYSGGLPTDLFVHLITGTHTLTGVDMPARVIGSGGIFNYPKREVPDQMTAIVEYPNAFTLTLTSTATNGHNFPPLLIMGTEGSLEYYGDRLVYHAEPVLENYTYSTNHFPAAAKAKFAELHDLDPGSMRPRATSTAKRPAPQVIDTPGAEPTQRHMEKFFECVRTRTEPTENAAAGHRFATVGHMVNLSYRAGKPATWNRAKGSVEVG